MGSTCSTANFVLFPDDEKRETRSVVTNDGQIRVYARGSSRRNSNENMKIRRNSFNNNDLTAKKTART